MKGFSYPGGSPLKQKEDTPWYENNPDAFTESFKKHATKRKRIEKKKRVLKSIPGSITLPGEGYLAKKMRVGLTKLETFRKKVKKRQTKKPKRCYGPNCGMLPEDY